MERQFASETGTFAPASGHGYLGAPQEGLSFIRRPSTHGPEAGTDLLPRDRSERLNRVVNVVLAATAIALLSPLLLLIAIAVRLTSPGPIFYRQTRIGIDRRRDQGSGRDTTYDRRACDLGGQAFSILKFRSMAVDAECRSGVVWAQKHDPRVTPLGRILRKTRLDELPQLLNVLRGEMNIVGPRPERPSIVARLRRDIGEYAFRQRAKPGITGLAQINHSYDASVDDVRVKVRYDLEYLRRQSLVEDARIMLLTIPVMLFRRGGW
jgi:lipopolysaccharide/colanic/teichoic acid biosynthesis glycosyltransferase